MSKSIYTHEYGIFRDLLRESRIASGLTQTRLSEVLGMPQSFVSKYETGERRLDLVEVRTVCASLGITLPNFVSKFEAKLRDAAEEGAL